MVVVQSFKKNRLTATFIKTAGTGKHHDGGGAGLIFKVSKNGRRGWVQRIVINGKRREIGLGSYPIVSLAEARQTALENKQLSMQERPQSLNVEKMNQF